MSVTAPRRVARCSTSVARRSALRSTYLCGLLFPISREPFVFAAKRPRPKPGIAELRLRQTRPTLLGWKAAVGQDLGELGLLVEARCDIESQLQEDPERADIVQPERCSDVQRVLDQSAQVRDGVSREQLGSNFENVLEKVLFELRSTGQQGAFDLGRHEVWRGHRMTLPYRHGAVDRPSGGRFQRSPSRRFAERGNAIRQTRLMPRPLGRG